MRDYSAGTVQVIVAEGQHPSLHGAKLYSYKEAEAGGHSYWISAQVRHYALVDQVQYLRYLPR